jgi:hypothetical protein
MSMGPDAGFFFPFVCALVLRRAESYFVHVAFYIYK